MKPILFEFGSFHLYSYGLMVAAGVLAALFLMLRLARREGFPNANQVYDLIFVTILTGFLGARVLYVLQNFSWYAAHPVEIIAIWEGGLVFYGGMAGALIGVIVFSKLKGLSVLRVFDFLMPFVAFAHAFGRIGCFLNGCCYGKFCELPWAVTFPHLDHPVHPTQLYEALFNFALFFFLYSRYIRQHATGEIMGLYFAGYAVGRFAIEFWRGDNPLWYGLTLNQWGSLLVFTAAAVFLMVLRKTTRHAA